MTGKPVVVVQYPTSRHDIEDMGPDDNRVVEDSASSIIAVSYEARPSGVSDAKNWPLMASAVFPALQQLNEMFIQRLKSSAESLSTIFEPAAQKPRGSALLAVLIHAQLKALHPHRFTCQNR